MERANRDYHVLQTPDDHVMSFSELIAASQEADAMLICHSEHFVGPMIKRLSDRLKIVANHSVGVDHCDLSALRDRGISVTNTPDVLSDATAEIAMLLMLGAARRAYEGDNMVRSGIWKDWAPKMMNGFQITGKKLGIVGMGRVGQVVAKRASGFGMEVHYHNRSKLPDTIITSAIYHESLESLLSTVDVVSLNCPATEENYNLINRETLYQMKRGSILVNTARGALVDEDALIESLNSGHLRAAGLDCFKQEPGGNPKLSELQQVFMLPHIGSATDDTRAAMGFRALDNLDQFFAGKTPQDLLN
jgi:lactate dehydrogenase-like 2-hydroxyacid dehydrogenase